MEDCVNYLTTLNPTVFEHLFKFVGTADSYGTGVNALRTAYNLSVPPAPAGQTSPANQASEYFHKSARVAVIWESVSLWMRLGVRTRRPRYAMGLDRNCLRRYKTQIKHLALVISSFYMEQKSYDFLAKDFVGETPTLKTFTVVTNISKTTLRLAPDNQVKNRFPPVTQLLREMVRKGVEVSLEVNVTARDLNGMACRFCRDITEDKEICRHITCLKLHGCFSVCNLSTIVAPFLAFVERLPVLQHLEIDVLNLSEGLLHALAQTVRRNPSWPLRTLTVSLGTEGERRFSGFPDLSEQAWESLVQVCPGLQVSCVLHYVPDNVLLTVLKPNVPLVNITIFEVCPASQNNIISTCEHFSQTLQFFRCFTNPRFQTGKFEELVSDKYMMSRVTRGALQYALRTKYSHLTMWRVAPRGNPFNLTITVI